MDPRYIQLHVFAERTGYSVNALKMKIRDGVWVEGQQYKRAPDSHILVDVKGYESWVEGQRLVA